MLHVTKNESVKHKGPMPHGTLLSGLDDYGDTQPVQANTSYDCWRQHSRRYHTHTAPKHRVEKNVTIDLGHRARTTEFHVSNKHFFLLTSSLR